MSFRIEGPKHIEAKSIERSTTHTEESHITTFGDGYADTKNRGITVEKNIPGLETLLTQFDFETPEYTPHIEQFNPSDKDYETYAYLDNALDEPEPAFVD